MWNSEHRMRQFMTEAARVVKEGLQVQKPHIGQVTGVLQACQELFQSVLVGGGDLVLIPEHGASYKAHLKNLPAGCRSASYLG